MKSFSDILNELHHPESGTKRIVNMCQGLGLEELAVAEASFRESIDSIRSRMALLDPFSERFSRCEYKANQLENRRKLIDSLIAIKAKDLDKKDREKAKESIKQEVESLKAKLFRLEQQNQYYLSAIEELKQKLKSEREYMINWKQTARRFLGSKWIEFTVQVNQDRRIK